MADLMMICPRCWGTARDPDTSLTCSYCKGTKQVKDQYLAPHFKLSELLFSDTAVRKLIPNEPTDDIVKNLTRTAGFLEQLRSEVNVPLHVNSGFRCSKLNTAIGGSKTSAHRFGLAADILPIGMGRKEFMQACVKAPLAYDQYIYEGTWVHVGVAYPGTFAQREEELMAFPNAKGEMEYFPYNPNDSRVV